MKWFILTIIKLLLLDVCVSYENVCEETFRDIRPKYVQKNKSLFYLITSNEEYHQKINNIFIQYASKFHFKISPVENFCPESGLMATEIVARHHLNVINLYAEELDYNRILSKELTFAESTDTMNISVCVERRSNFNESHNLIERGKCIEESAPIIKLISKNIKQYNILYELINKISIDTTEIENWEKYVKVSENYFNAPVTRSSILICIRDATILTQVANILNEIHKDVTLIYITDCERINDYYESDLLAALMPTPVELEDRVLMPVIFYDVPFLLLEDKDIYPHSMTLYETHNLCLAKTLLSFMNLRGWKRIAIISDDSPYSEQFESILTTMFNKEKIVFTVQRCVNKLNDICNFKKALNNIKSAPDGKIIIANVNEEHAIKLARTAVEQFQMTRRQGYVWIWRDQSLQKLQYKGYGDFFSLCLTADIESLLNANVNEYWIIERKKTYVGNLLKGITAAKRAKETWNNLQDLLQNNNKKDFYKNIAKKIKSTLENTTEVYGHIRKISSNGQSDFVFSALLTIDESSKEVKTNTFKYQPISLPPDLRDCYVRTNKYFDPCEQHLIVLMLLIIIGFVVGLMVIPMFFNRYKLQRLLMH